MAALRTGSLASLALLLVLATQNACTIETKSSVEVPRPDPFDTSAFRPVQQGAPSTEAPAPRYNSGTFLQLGSGWSGAALLPDNGRTECAVDRRFGHRTFQAFTSDFAQFDSGSGRPGEDFSIEVWIPGDEPERAGFSAEELRTSVLVTVVSEDGTHQRFDAWSPADVTIAPDGDTRLAFSAESTTASGAPVSIRGYVVCDEVAEYS